MRTFVLACAVVLLCPAWASQQEPAPMVLTFDKIPDDGTCTAAYRIAAGIRIEEATGERAPTRFDSASPHVPGQVRIEINPSIYGATRDDRFRMRMLLAGCGYREVDKGDLGSASILWGAGFVIAAFDHSTDLRALKKQTEDFNEALRRLPFAPGHSLGDQPFEPSTTTEALKKKNVKQKFEVSVRVRPRSKSAPRPN